MIIYNKQYSIEVYKHATGDKRCKPHYLITFKKLDNERFDCFLVRNVKDWIPNTTTQQNLDKNYIKLEYAKLSKELKRKVCMILHQQQIEEPFYKFTKYNKIDTIEESML